MRTTSRLTTLRDAADRLGGADALARYVNAPPADVARWLDGNAEAPELYLLRSVEALHADPAQVQDLARREAGVLVLDRQTLKAHVRGRAIALPLGEWAVLESLGARLGRVVPRAQIHREAGLWAGRAVADAVQMHVFRLRLKLAPLQVAIRNVRPGGYVLHA